MEPDEIDVESIYHQMRNSESIGNLENSPEHAQTFKIQNKISKMIDKEG